MSGSIGNDKWAFWILCCFIWHVLWQRGEALCVYICMLLSCAVPCHGCSVVVVQKSAEMVVYRPLKNMDAVNLLYMWLSMLSIRLRFVLECSTFIISPGLECCLHGTTIPKPLSIFVFYSHFCFFNLLLERTKYRKGTTNCCLVARNRRKKYRQNSVEK